MRAQLLVAVLAASSCGVQFTPETLVDSLRILLEVLADGADEGTGWRRL